MCKRIFCICLVMLLLYSCGGKPVEETESVSFVQETETVETEDPNAPDLPDVRFEDTDFRILYLGGPPAVYGVIDLWTEEYTGEILNDSTYDRNSMVEDRFGIKIQGEPQTQMISRARSEIMAGTNSFDVYSDTMVYLFNLSVENLLLDWNTLQYVHIDAPYWDGNMAKDVSLRNKLYFMAGDISSSVSSGVRFLYTNKNLMQNYNMEMPYQDVRDGTWTLDKMNNIITTVSEDLNGDGFMDTYDRYGIVTETYEFFAVGCGVFSTVKNENDEPVFNVANEYTVDVLNKLGKILRDEASTISIFELSERDTGGMNVFDFARRLFASDQYMFFQGGALIAYQFADMESEYGILPNPKYMEEQENYWTRADIFPAALSIPTTVENSEMVDMVLEYMAYVSTDTVKEAFYETTIKKRRLDAPDDAEMLDIIYDNIRFEISDIGYFGAGYVLNEGYTNGNLMSAWASQGTALEKALQSILDQLG